MTDLYHTYQYVVEHRQVNEREERFTIKGRNGQIVLSSNRPFFRNRGLKKRKPDYTLIEGQLRYRSFLEQIIEAINQKVNP